MCQQEKLIQRICKLYVRDDLWTQSYVAYKEWSECTALWKKSCLLKAFPFNWKLRNKSPFLLLAKEEYWTEFFSFKISIKSFGKVFEKMLGTSLIISKCRVLQVSLIRCRILRLFGPQKIHSMGFHGNPSRLHHYKCWIFVKV